MVVGLIREERNGLEEGEKDASSFLGEETAEEEECETIEDTEDSQGLVDVEEIDVEIEKYKKGSSQEFQGADG